eukprot:jgi/Mesvir1/6131/Mv00835-RA.1
MRAMAFGLLAGLALVLVRRKLKCARFDRVRPRLVRSADGKVEDLETFGHYFVRQLGLTGDAASSFEQAANSYVKGDKGRFDDSRSKLLELFERAQSCTAGANGAVVDVGECKAVCLADVIAELDSCMVAYFGFHWGIADEVIARVTGRLAKKQSSSGRLRALVRDQTRESRYQKIVTTLRPQRQFKTILQQLKSLQSVAQADDRVPGPADNINSSNAAPGSSPHASGASSALPPPGPTTTAASTQPRRRPVVLFLGGGMGAGKSTAVAAVMERGFWGLLGEARVLVVEADAFKESDVVYQAMRQRAEAEGGTGERGGDGLGASFGAAEASARVHADSLRAAMSTFVAGVNMGKDIIFDGTMSWVPFVEQTVAMLRDAHRTVYRCGPGYVEHPDGSVEERYWEPVPAEECAADGCSGMGGVLGGGSSAPSGGVGVGGGMGTKQPYWIEMVGVACDPELAVVRGMRRALLTGRGVPVRRQLASHRMFAAAFERYVRLVDKATLFSSNVLGGAPRIIAYKEGNSTLMVDREEYPRFQAIALVDENAQSAEEIRRPALLARLGRGMRSVAGVASHSSGVVAAYGGDTWQDIVFAPQRCVRQRKIRDLLSLYTCLKEGEDKELDSVGSGARSGRQFSSGKLVL